MSCGNPHAVDCGEVLARVTVFLEHSLSENGHLGYESIEQHLVECQPCLDQFGGHVEELQRAVRAALTRTCGGEHAPDDLRLRVLQHIRVARATTT
jgi:anti-sigma factor (TIGR02949 family)